MRLFHWGIVVLVGVSWLCASRGWMRLHFLSGYTILAALLFRIVWGFVGSDTARFVRFMRSPFAAVHHLTRLHRREADTEIGHNAAGGWMVLVMLLLLLVQVGAGLCANDDGDTEGPLANYVGKDWSDWLSHIHAVNFKLIQLAVVLHVVAVAAYALIKRHDLVRPMITGTKTMQPGMQPPRMASPKLALVVFAVAVAIVAAFANAL